MKFFPERPTWHYAMNTQIGTRENIRSCEHSLKFLRLCPHRLSDKSAPPKLRRRPYFGVARPFGRLRVNQCVAFQRQINDGAGVHGGGSRVDSAFGKGGADGTSGGVALTRE